MKAKGSNAPSLSATFRCVVHFMTFNVFLLSAAEVAVSAAVDVDATFLTHFCFYFCSAALSAFC